MAPRSRLIESLPGYSREIGHLVAMMTYTRQTTLAAVKDLTERELDYLHDAGSNSIGGLLAHITAVEAYYQAVSLDGRPLTPEEDARLGAALALGDRGRAEIRGLPLERYLVQMDVVRSRTLAELAKRNDSWLTETVTLRETTLSHHWIWFHVFEDELNHRGQIRWLKARAPGASPTWSRRADTR